MIPPGGYTEISKTKLSLYSSLGTKKMRRRHGLFTVEGEKCVMDMLGAFELESIVAVEDWLERHSSMPGVDALKVFKASGRDMEKMSNLSTPPEVIAVMRLPQSPESLPLLDKDSLSLLVDGVQDPGNFGTIIRTADWFGFHEIYASPTSADVFNPKTIQATMGSLKRVRVVYCDLPQLVERSEVENVVGTLLDGVNIYETALPRSGVIVMGSEGSGVSEEMRRLINTPVLIPPFDPGSHAESLNVAVATGIVLSIFRK